MPRLLLWFRSRAALPATLLLALAGCASPPALRRSGSPDDVRVVI